MDRARGDRASRPQAYGRAAATLVAALEREVGELYRTDCPAFGDKRVPVKYFLWVKTIACQDCRQTLTCFPGYLLADNTRHPRNVLVCPDCGELNEVADTKNPGACSHCRANCQVDGPAKRNRCACKSCGAVTRYPRKSGGPLGRRLFAIEYANPRRRGEHKGRLFKKPDTNDCSAMCEGGRAR